MDNAVALAVPHKGIIGGAHVGFASLPVSCGKPRTIAPLVWLQTQINKLASICSCRRRTARWPRRSCTI